MTRTGLLLCVAVTLFATGCARKGKPDFKLGRNAERLHDYDAAFDYYQKALQHNPEDAEYIVKFHQARFQASTQHVKQGWQLRERGDLQGAATEFQRALAIDPSSPAAEQELRKTVALINEKERAADAAAQPPQPEGHLPALASGPPQLKPLDGGPINLHMTNDVKIVYETIAKLAGITVVFDPELQARSIPANLSNLTLEQALEVVALQSKTFWKPVTENIIFVASDQPAKRRDYDEEVVRTFYLSNTVQPTDLTEIMNGLRTLLNLQHIQQVTAQNAIVIRDTPDKIAVAEKMIEDSDRARPEVVVQVHVVEARVDRRRNLGIVPPQSNTVQIVPPGASTSTTSTTSSSTITFDQLRNLKGSNYSITVPSFTANALLSDSTTKIIQNPEIRSVDGQSAKLRIGDRVPIATGSFQAGVGVGGAAGGFLNPLVNTQFQYQEVGVNIDITPRVHPNREVSLKVSVEVSSVTGTSNIGGIQQPIISQRKIDHEIRLKEGEANILGGLITRSDTKSLSGWPGLAKIPLLRYFVSSEDHSSSDDEILVIMTPHIVRLPEWTRANLRSLYSGSETEVRVLRESEVRAPSSAAPQPPAGPASAGQAPAQKPGTAAGGPQQATSPPQIRFEPRSVTLKVGQTQTIGLVVENVKDLFSIPMLLQYSSSVISVEDIQHGSFLSGGNQEIAIVYHDDKQHGQTIISATRQPNTVGVNGTGTILGIVVKGIAPGTATLSIVQVNAKDSQQRSIPLVSLEATVQVQP